MNHNFLCVGGPLDGKFVTRQDRSRFKTIVFPPMSEVLEVGDSPETAEVVYQPRSLPDGTHLAVAAPEEVSLKMVVDMLIARYRA